MEISMNILAFPIPNHQHVLDMSAETALAVARVGALLDDASHALETVLRDGGATKALAALHALHLDPDEGDPAALLRSALHHLETILDALHKLPNDADETSRALPADYDAAVRWCGARVQDAVETLRRAVS
jgi:hypothetical protein